MSENNCLASNIKERYKIAFIKESCHPDLWVGDKIDSHIDLVRSTLLRIGPIGLLDIFGADFYIVESNFSKASNQIRKAQLPHLSKKDFLKFQKKKQKYNISRLPERCPADFEKDINDIDLINYDIVISLNFAIPLNLRNRYPNILWLCLTGEGRYPIQVNGWDYFISHDFPKSPTLEYLTIDMPYTFISSSFLEENIKINKREGIYLEINSISEMKPNSRKDWRENIEGINDLNKLKLPISYHPGNTNDHLNLLVSSNYFVKLGGRPVRGNSFLEAISAGCVCFLKSSDCYGNISFPDFCYFSNNNDLIAKISYLEENNSFREELILKQRSYLELMVRLVSMQIETALKEKRSFLKKNEYKKNTLKEKLKTKVKNLLQPFFSWTCYNCLIRLNTPLIDKSKYTPAIFEEE
tara:strand:- start:920 stop:2152 length:1233 start_codon:yes stop_codon:yes gene_type:complete